MAIFEYSYLLARKRKKVMAQYEIKLGSGNVKEPNCNITWSKTNPKSGPEEVELAYVEDGKVDRRAFKTYMVCFLLFHIIYVTVYASM